MRDMIFISHANPEDNDFARWLSLRLAREGYGVWCDLTKLLGGEAFWDDIEDAIRNRTVKFLYVLSKSSNDKIGARNELALARTTARLQDLRDFIIPLWIDDLSPGEFNVEIHRLNAIPFAKSWAKGLATLLEKLDEEGIKRKQGFDENAISRWWREHVAGVRIVQSKPETLVTNWCPLHPVTLFFHELKRDSIGAIRLPDNLPFPAVLHDQYLVSFAPAQDFEGKLGDGMRIKSSQERRLNDPESPGAPRLWRYRDERRHLTNLLRQTWNRFLADRALASYEFANGALGFFYNAGHFEHDTVWFPEIQGTKTRRQLVGYKSIKGSDGYPKGRRVWHFALEAKPTSLPLIGYTMRPHVLFSDDGKTIWESKDRLHRARRSQCKDWWNDDWRDRILATLHSIADDQGAIKLRVGENTYLAIGSTPMLLEATFSYDDKLAVQAHLDYEDDADGIEEELETSSVASLAPAAMQQTASA